jgi:hypothetical protein
MVSLAPSSAIDPTQCSLIVLWMGRRYATPADLDTRLFHDETEHVIVTCCSCKRVVNVKLGEVPYNIDRHEFERRSVCQSCGAKWPQIVRYPAPKSRW